MNFILSFLKSPQYILIFIIIAVLGYLFYDYQSLKSDNKEMSTKITLEARERRAIEEQYVALSNRVEQQQKALSRYIQGLQRIESDSEELKQQLQEINDERVRKSLDTILPSSITRQLFNNGRNDN